MSSIPAVADAYVLLKFVEGTSNKFWEARLAGTRLTTRWGRVGSSGQSKDYDHASVTAARSDYEKQVAGKLDKGYRVDKENGDRMRTLSDSLSILERGAE